MTWDVMESHDKLEAPSKYRIVYELQRAKCVDVENWNAGLSTTYSMDSER